MKALKVLVLALVVALVAVPMAGAQGGGTWDSSFNVVNLGTADATVTIDFYDETGAHPAVTQLASSAGLIPNPFPLAAGQSVEIHPFNTTELPAGHRYSVVISADQPVAAIANLTNWIDQGGAPYYNGSYSGAADESQTAQYLPAVVQNYYDWNSHLSVQNLTNAAQDVTLTFYTEGSDVVCYTHPAVSVQPYSAMYADVATLVLTGCDANADGYNGSVVASAAGPIAAVDNQTADTTLWGPAGRTQTYNGFSGGATELYAPALYYGYYGWDSSINVQNVGTASTEVTVTYSDGYVANATLPANGAALFYQYTEGQAGNHTVMTKFSAVISSDGEPLVAVVNAATNQPWPGGWAPYDQAQTYSAPYLGTASVGFPLIMREYYGWYTSYTIQNVGAADVNVLVSYGGMAPDCQNIAVGPIAAGANYEVYQGGATDPLCPTLPGAEQPGDPWGSSYRGAVTVVVDGTGEIVGIANQTNFYNRVTPANIGDWSMTYNGLGQ